MILPKKKTFFTCTPLSTFIHFSLGKAGPLTFPNSWAVFVADTGNQENRTQKPGKGKCQPGRERIAGKGEHTGKNPNPYPKSDFMAPHQVAILLYVP